MSHSECGSIREQDHNVKGLFVKELSPTSTGRMGSPIVMVHGGSHGWWAFEQWQPFFAERGWSTFSLSLRNHTDSYSVPLHEYLRLKVADYVEDVLAVVEWMGETPIFMGHSMGGIVVQKASETANPSALVLVAPVPPGRMGVLRDPLPTDRTVLPDCETVRRLWFHAIDDKTLLSVCERLVPESPSVMNDYGNGRLVVDAAALHFPILVVGGDRDRSGLPSARSVAEFLGAEWTLLPECGHEVMLEPKSFQAAAAIEEWLRTVMPSPHPRPNP
jgi:pimeloyl-ACP methyl ester carboxylesterase